MSTPSAFLLAAVHWQLWHVVALAVGFLALIVAVRRLRRSGRKGGQAAFLSHHPDAAKLYIQFKADGAAPCFAITCVNGSRPCRFRDPIGHGVFVSTGDCAIVVDGDRPVTLEFQAAAYGAYRLARDKNNKPMIIETKSL